MARVPPLIWRLGVFWQDTLLDTATVAGRGRVALRTGAVFDVEVDRGCVILRGEGIDTRLAPGGATLLASGHVVVVGLDRACARAPRSFDVDSTFLHATMVGLATTICLFSALWFAPIARFDQGGAGMPAEARRWLTLPGGAARSTGAAVFRASGRRPHEAERLLVEQRRGRPLPPRPGPGPSLQRTIELMKQALHGADGHSLRDAVGELSRAIAAAPVLGAGVGGLSPRDPVVAGPGAGVIAAGSTAQLSSVLRRRTEAVEAAQPAPPRRPTYPVQLVDVPDAAVDAQRIDAAAALDPSVREQLVRAVRLRSNVLRGCYESWGLVADHLRSGRLVVELTLLPDGHVASVTTTTTAGLQAVGDCVARAAGEWYLGDGLVDEPLRLSFPFLLRPRT